jgi:VWFA-related protein
MTFWGKLAHRSWKTDSAAVSTFMLAVGLATSGLHAQAPASPTPAVPEIKMNVDEVSLDLQAHDYKNRPILDLEASQLSVTDDGVPVKLSNLRLVQGEPIHGRKITFLFGNLDTAGDKNARDVAGKILKAIPDGFSFSVMNVGSRLRLLQAFTTNRTLVEKGLEMATIQDAPGVVGPYAEPEKNLVTVVHSGKDASGASVPAQDRATGKVVLASLQESQRVVQDQHSQPVLASLLALARTQMEIPGRKVILYFTQGFQTDSNAIDMVHSIVGAANRSGVTFYAIDLSSLDANTSNSMVAAAAIGAVAPGLRAAANAPIPRGGVDMGAPGMKSSAADQAGRIENEGLAGTDSPLGALAVNTGGAFIAGGDSLKKPLKNLIDDLTTYYAASFVPPNSEYDGRFRNVQITSTRKNVVLRYRAGYYAMAPGSSYGTKPFEVPLLKLLTQSPLPSELQFRTAVLRMGNLQEGNANTLVIEAPLGELDVHEDPNTKLYSLHVSVVAQIKDKSGTVIDHFSEDVPRHGAIESLQGSNSDVVTVQRHFIAPPGEYVLEAAIFDQNSKKAGAQKLTFQVPDSPPGQPVLSDLTLVRRTDPFHVDSDPAEPMHFGSAKVVPNLSGEVAKDAKEISVFFMIHPDGSAAPVKLEMEVRKNGKSVGRTPLPFRPEGGAAGVVPYLGTIQARSLSAGHYEVAAVLTQGDKTTEGTVGFTIGETEVASADAPSGTKNPAAAGDKDAETASDSLSNGLATPLSTKLVITSPANPVPAPKPDEVAAIIASTRARALHYSESLPNFSCVEITTRSLDANGKGQWKLKDKVAQQLTYRDEAETRVMLELNGKRTHTPPEDEKGMSSHGQFGGALKAVFDPSSKAEFEWKETVQLGSGLAQVFSYTVEQKNSNYALTTHDNTTLAVAFHGLVFIDTSTMGVRRITLEANNIPHDFYIHASSMAVDYDYVVINRHDYLMPIHAEVRVRQGKHQGVLNEIEFRDFRRFGSRVRMIGANEAPAK